MIYLCCMENLVNKLFIKSGRPEQGDNRNYFVNALNKILNDGFITIEIQEKGRVWTNPRNKNEDGSLKKFNIEIKGYNFVYRSYDNNFNAKDLLTKVAKFIQKDEIKNAHVLSMSVNSLETCECDRCSGQGFIKQFDYYCNGICFKCYGSKYMVTKKTLTI